MSGSSKFAPMSFGGSAGSVIRQISECQQLGQRYNLSPFRILVFLVAFLGFMYHAPLQNNTEVEQVERNRFRATTISPTIADAITSASPTGTPTAGTIRITNPPTSSAPMTPAPSPSVASFEDPVSHHLHDTARGYMLSYKNLAGKEGIGSTVLQNLGYIQCALRLGLQPVCNSFGYETREDIHHTGNLGFLFGCINKYMALGRFASEADTGFAMTFKHIIQEHQVDFAFEALKNTTRMTKNLTKAYGFRPESLAPDGKPVFYRVQCDLSDALLYELGEYNAVKKNREKRAEDEKLGKKPKELYFKSHPDKYFFRSQYQFVYEISHRSVPLWKYPENEKWRIIMTVRAGDRDIKHSHADRFHKALLEIYKVNPDILNENNTQVIVFSEIAPNSTDFDAFRLRPEVDLHLAEKETDHKKAVVHLTRDIDHLIHSHIFLGTKYSRFSSMLASLMPNDAASLIHNHGTRYVQKMLAKHDKPFALDFNN